jgi:hypothetical protein
MASRAVGGRLGVACGSKAVEVARNTLSWAGSSSKQRNNGTVGRVQSVEWALAVYTCGISGAWQW